MSQYELEKQLVDSCSEGNEQKVRELLQKGVNPNCVEEVCVFHHSHQHKYLLFK